MKSLLPLLILINCHTIQGVLEWMVIEKVTHYGQNVTLFCNVSNCCPKYAGWDMWTPKQRTLFIDIKTARANKKYDGRISKDGYTLIIQKLNKQDLNISYSCVYGVTLGERKVLLEEDVFIYISTTQPFGNRRLSSGVLAAIITGSIGLLLLLLTISIYIWRRKNYTNSIRNKGYCRTDKQRSASSSSRSYLNWFPDCIATLDNRRSSVWTVVEVELYQFEGTAEEHVPLKGLCTKCRKSLLKQAQCEELSLDVSKIVQDDQQPYLRQETHISDHEMTDNVPEFSSRTTVDSYSQPDHVHVEANEEHTCMSITNRRKRKAKECLLDDLVLSQETDQSLAGGSQVSEASVCVIEKLDKLNEFLSLSGISPVKKIQGPLESASARTIQRYKLKARQCLNSVFETICPGEAPFIEAELYPESLKDNTMKTLLEIYTKADTWMFRRQVLSILTEQLNYDALRKMIPNITQWRYYEAKRHTDKSGAGQPVQPSKQQREKFDAKCLEHFIDFITSNQIIKDLPFGDKTLRLSTGEIRNIPNVVRSIAPVSIIKQYNQLCEEDQVKPLGTSTLYKLLDECAASVRKSMEGLDNYITEGGRAFVELEKLVVLLPGDTQALKTRPQEAKQYLKTDMKIHVRQTSTVADHCAPYALSTSDPCFKGVCDHEHDSRCDSCSDMADLFDMLLTKVIANTWENRDSVLYTVEKAIDDIKEWKKHLVRARNQEEARRNLTDKMNENEALITFDSAMKFLPRKYREGQVDWYAKRGINWHISVSLMKKGVTFDSITHVHIFENPTSQDADVTSQIMVDVVTDLVKVLPTLNKFHLFSDNAGCYKSSTTLTQLHSGLGNLLDTYNFSEAQNGKGPCDRKASHIKSSIKRYVNEGNDVITAQQMKQAIDQNQQGKYKVKVVNAVTNLDSGANIIKSNIPEITSLHNFKFTEDALVVWKAYNIGEGKTILWTQLKSNSNKELSVVLDWRDVALTRFQEDENESTDMNTQIKKRAIFMCPVEGCVREFSTNSNLDNHLLLGNCDYKLEKQCLTDLAITIHSKKINDGFPSSTSGQHGQRSECGNNISTEGDYINPMGWALKGKRKKTVFSTAQKQYMKEQFDIGKRTGKKVDPFYAAEEMRKLRQFDKKTFLSGQQIASYFSRLAQLDRKADLGDIIAAKEEDQKTLLKKEIMDKLNK